MKNAYLRQDLMMSMVSFTAAGDIFFNTLLLRHATYYSSTRGCDTKIECRLAYDISCY